MTPRVDFYLCEHLSPDAHLRTVCRIVDKAYKQQHHILVCCTDKRESQILDQLLWTFHDISFIPHEIWQHKSTDVPIIIYDNSHEPPEQCHDILINLSNSVPTFMTKFQRIIEIVSAQPEARQLARERYRNYRELGCDLHSHQIK